MPANVFAGPTAEFEPWLSPSRPNPDGPLRVLTVEERVGQERKLDLVRVPLYFHADECPDPQMLKLVRADKPETAVPYQLDDIRLSPSGGIARMHLYFEVNLQPWEQQQFLLFNSTEEQASSPMLKLQESETQVTLRGEDLAVTFWKSGPQSGALAAIESNLGPISLPHQQLAPRLVLQRQAADLSISRSSPLAYRTDAPLQVRSIRYGAGSLFSKLVVQIAPPGLSDIAQYTYIVPKHGAWFSQAVKLFPSEEETTDVVGAKQNFLLQGRLLLGEAGTKHEIVQVPAGLRKLVRSVHGHTSPALVNLQAGLSLLPIPQVQTAVAGMAGGGEEGYISVLGTESFERTAGANSNSLRSFWTQVRYVFTPATTVEALWEASLIHRQPLVAIVDEPWITREDFHSRLAQLMAEWPPHHSRDWKQEVGRLFTAGEQEQFAKRYAQGGRPGEDTEEAWLNSARQASAKLTEDGKKPVQQWEKGRASGSLDPWQLGYGASPAPVLSALVQPSPYIDRMALAIGRAQRSFNGRVDEFGFPYIDCFNTAFNMQVGSVLMGLQGGKQAKDWELMQYYRDVARTPAVLDIYGNAERTYPSLRATGGNSDVLYQMTSDFYLRMAELATGEDLWLHPAVHGRYTDMVDVQADQMHRRRLPQGDDKGASSWRRANFFRGQCHDHRWEAWSVGPFARLLKQQPEGPLVGLTEAVYYSDYLLGKSKNWVEITTFFHAHVATREHFQPPKLASAPALPQKLTVQRIDHANQVHWEPVAGKIQGYRIYRAPKMGGPWTFLNSPYRESAAALVRDPKWTDGEGQPDDVYFVTAVDAQGRESRWFDEE